MLTEPKHPNNTTLDEEKLLQALRALRAGDLSVRMPKDGRGTAGEISTAFNEIVDLLRDFSPEVTRIAREIGADSHFGPQMEVAGIGESGVWHDLTHDINEMAANLTNQVRNLAFVVTAVANGDLTHKITVDARGELLDLKNTVNVMVDQLNSFGAQMTSVVRAVASTGVNVEPARVNGASGMWQDLVSNLNIMAAQLLEQMSDMNNVTRAALEDDFSQRVALNGQPPILELQQNINTLLDRLGA